MSQCEPCTAAWGDIELDCANPALLTPHDDKCISLAEALAQAFNPWESEDTRLQHIGWFMEDAEDIIGSGKVAGPPWKVKVITLTDQTKFSVNGRFCIAHDGEKDRGYVEVFGSVVPEEADIEAPLPPAAPWGFDDVGER